MKHMMKKMIGALTAVMVLSAVPAFAIEPIDGMMPTVNPLVPLYGSFNGTVTEIFPEETAGTVHTILVESEDGQAANFILGAETLWLTEGTTAQIGDAVIGFYDNKMPMIELYPPQYTIAVMVVNIPDGMEAVVDWFGDGVITSGAYQLSINEHTQILTPDGEAFNDDAGFPSHILAVLHDPASDTLDLPAPINTWKIIVMHEADSPKSGDYTVVTHPIGIIEPEAAPTEAFTLPQRETDASVVIGNVEEMDIIVNDVKITGPKATMADGVIMVPLRTIAEGLDFAVTWEPETKSIMLNNMISLRVGEDAYTFARMPVIQLGAAPVIIDTHTYVPLHFFTEVTRMSNAYVYEGQIVVNDLEKME